jgi:membrane protein
MSTGTEDRDLPAAAPTAGSTTAPAGLRRAIGTRVDAFLARRSVRQMLVVVGIYNDAGGGLLAAGLAFGALFASLTGLLFAFGVLGYVVPSEADRQRLVDGLTANLAPLAPIAKDGLESVAAHAGAFSLIGLAGLAWGAIQFYGSIDTALARIFVLAPARGFLDRLLRGAVSVALLVGGLMSGIALSAVQSMMSSSMPIGSGGDPGRMVSAVGFPVVTALVVIAAVGALYRVVPNTRVPLKALALPALVTGIVLTILTEAFVFLAPRLVGGLSVFGGFAAVFAALTWLSFAFQVLLLGASWTRLRLGDLSSSDNAGGPESS